MVSQFHTLTGYYRRRVNRLAKLLNDLDAQRTRTSHVEAHLFKEASENQDRVQRHFWSKILLPSRGHVEGKHAQTHGVCRLCLKRFLSAGSTKGTSSRLYQHRHKLLTRLRPPRDKVQVWLFHLERCARSIRGSLRPSLKLEHSLNIPLTPRRKRPCHKDEERLRLDLQINKDKSNYDTKRTATERSYCSNRAADYARSVNSLNSSCNSLALFSNLVSKGPRLTAPLHEPILEQRIHHPRSVLPGPSNSSLNQLRSSTSITGLQYNSKRFYFRSNITSTHRSANNWRAGFVRRRSDN